MLEAALIPDKPATCPAIWFSSKLRHSIPDLNQMGMVGSISS